MYSHLPYYLYVVAMLCCSEDDEFFFMKTSSRCVGPRSSACDKMVSFPLLSPF
jgi:hypothetical protein